MADKSLEFKITADVTSLQSQSAVAKVELGALNASVRSLAKEFVSASDDMKASINVALLQTVERTDVAKVHLQSLQAQIAKNSEASLASQGAFAKISAGMDETAKKVDGLTSKFGAIGKLTMAISEFVMAGLAIEQVGHAIESTAETGEQIGQLAEKTGMATTTISGLRVAAIETNTDMNSLATGLRNLGKNLEAALANPASAAAQNFNRLGIAFHDAQGNALPLTDVLNNTGVAFAGFEDGAAKATDAGAMFGSKVGTTLLPVLDKIGTQTIPGLVQRSQDLGVAFDAAAVAADTKFAESMKDSGLTVEGLKDTVSNALIPALTVLETAFTTNTGGMSEMHAASVSLADGLKGVVEVGTAVVTFAEEIFDGLRLLGKEMGDIILMDEALKEAMQLNFGEAAATVKQAATQMGQAWTVELANMSAHEQTFANVHNALWNGLQAPPVVTAPPLPAAPDLAGDGGKSGVLAAKASQDQITQIAADAANARKVILTSEYDAQVSKWGEEVAQGKITKAQEVQDEIAAQDQMYTADLAAAQKAAALLPAGTAAKAKALDDIEVMEAEHNAKMASLDAELVTAQIEQQKTLADAQKAAADATTRAWQNAFQPISQAFDSSINGILQGTQTLQNAEARAASSIVLAFVDAEAKKVLAFAAGEAMSVASVVRAQLGMTAAVTAGVTAQTAAKATGAAAGKALDITTGTAQISGDAMKAAAGAYAAVAGIPIIGPVLAPVAAATAYAGVMAYDVLSASGGLAIGSGQNPLVQLHENETVLPAYIAKPLTAMLTGGTTNNSSRGGDTFGDVNFNVTAQGGRGGVSSNDILSTLNNAVRSGSMQSYPALARALRRGN